MSRRALAILAALIVCVTGASAAAAQPSADPDSGSRASTHYLFRQTDHVLTVAAPAYQIVITRKPFQITTRRGHRTVLASTNQDALGFDGPNGRVSATDVRHASWVNGVLTLQVGTTDPGATLTVTITPSADRYRIDSAVEGVTASATGMKFDMASAGHWYGHGETTTDDGGPYTDQPWPLDNNTVADDEFGPASYQMVEPFWFTQSSAGLWVDTGNVMHVSLGQAQAGVADMEVTDSSSFSATIFVERTPKAVYDDYIGIAGKPAKSDAQPYQYATPVWNSWAQFYTTVTQAAFLDWAQRLHDAGVPGHTMSLDDGWMSHYGDFTFNDKFPDPKGMSDQIHKMGYKFGLWVTLWINQDAANYKIAKDKGYLLKSKTDPSQPCNVDWWNGTAGIVDLGNPAARQWYADQLHTLEKTYSVDGFKFDTRFFDESCAPDPGLTQNDYLKLGAQLVDQFDQQGVGVRLHWTGSQKNGFVIREIDKNTDWGSLQAGIKQDLAISTVGYPFVETDMIGGSGSQRPPSESVLIRWAEAAAAMPLMYSSTSPVRVYDFPDKKWVDYPPETAGLYTKAVNLHHALAPYIQKQVKRAVATGEPIMKPLFFDFPKDQAGYTIGDEWLLGDSLLAAPVLSDATTRDIHLPPGQWYDVARHRVVHGELHNYPAPLGTLPLFVRMGTSDTNALKAALRR